MSKLVKQYLKEMTHDWIDDHGRYTENKHGSKPLVDFFVTVCEAYNDEVYDAICSPEALDEALGIVSDSNATHQGIGRRDLSILFNVFDHLKKEYEKSDWY